MNEFLLQLQLEGKDRTNELVKISAASSRIPNICVMACPWQRQSALFLQREPHSLGHSFDDFSLSSSFHAPVASLFKPSTGVNIRERSRRDLFYSRLIAAGFSRRRWKEGQRKKKKKEWERTRDERRSDFRDGGKVKKFEPPPTPPPTLPPSPLTPFLSFWRLSQPSGGLFPWNRLL